ncbi:Proton pump-interactor 1 [Apostasia shenzhenica]|uniref:Proton pump-interactor 1 n=1 Tax=Apostasia shenzhenica TaxID=1088818 RepID=A0A2I0B9J0_9ASPA|nr:Proton pump-interactor 1 [Apostasia shenzhenica]
MTEYMGVEVLSDGVVPEQTNNEINGEGMLVNKVDEPNNSCLLDEPNVANGGIKESEPSTGSSVPKDAVDEWPEPKKDHTFYFVKYRSYEDPKLKAKLDQADKELQRNTQARTKLIEALKAKRVLPSEKADIISELKPLQAEHGKFRIVLSEKRKEMEPLHDALGKLRGTKNATTEKGVGLCSSEEELDELIQSLQYRIQHESNTLAEEKQLLKEIKQLEASREKVIANAAMRAKIHESFGQRDAIQDQVKLIGLDLDGVRREQQSIGARIKLMEIKKNTIMTDIESLNKDLDDITGKRTKAYEEIAMLRKERDESNASFFEYRSLVSNAKSLAVTKDIAALEELAHNEVEKFMSQWSNSKAFRDDYERRTLSSLDFRQLSKDGRMRIPDEKPIVSEALASTEVVNESTKASMKKEKENVIPPRHEEAEANKAQEQVVKPSEVRERRKAPDAEKADVAEKADKETSKNEIDPAKLKEMKREEEIAKAKLALERKKKLAEKAAAKATARAQKEAEKKQKEKEKKARKKAAASSQSGGAEPQETEMRDVEQEQDEPNLNTEVPALEKSKEEQKEKAIKLPSRMKSQKHIPRSILKKKKSHSYWLWAASAAIVALLLVVFAYFYPIEISQ